MIKFIAFCAFMALCIGSCHKTNAQTHKPSKVLMADETWSLETQHAYKVITCNDKIANALSNAFTWRTYNIQNKRDRLGDYMEYTLTFNILLKDSVAQYIKARFR